MQPGDVARDRWTHLVVLRPEARAGFVREWAASDNPGATVADAQLECDARVQYWIAELSTRLEHRAPGERIARAGRAAHHWAVHGVVVLGIACLVVLHVGVVMTIGYAVVFGLGVLVTIAARRARRRHFWGYWRALELGFCPGCGYDLSGLSHLESRGSTLLDVGPERCPECGAPWPLVPPPVPIKDTKA